LIGLEQAQLYRQFLLRYYKHKAMMRMQPF
jgi:hypothetical protein